MQRGETPRFTDLDEYTVQRLTNDVLAVEPSVMNTGLHWIVRRRNGTAPTSPEQGY